MLHRLFLTIIILASAISAWAQNGLNIEPFFDNDIQKTSDGKISIVIVEGDYLTNKSALTAEISRYASVTVRNDTDLIEKMEKAVTRDGTKALYKQVSYVDGQMTFGFFVIPPAKKENRYIYFLNKTPKGNPKAILIFISGAATTEEIQDLIAQ